MIVYWDDNDFAGLNWPDSLVYGPQFYVVTYDRFSYERMIIARCDTRDEAELVQDIKRAANKDRHLTNPIETDWEIWHRGEIVA